MSPSLRKVSYCKAQKAKVRILKGIPSPTLQKTAAGKLPQQVKVLASKPNDPSLNPNTQIQETIHIYENACVCFFSKAS